MGRKKTQDGPGRPQWVTRRDEVRLSKEDERALERWCSYSREKEKGRAYRRALLVVDYLEQHFPAVLKDAVEETEGVLK